MNKLELIKTARTMGKDRIIKMIREEAGRLHHQKSISIEMFDQLMAICDLAS